MARVIRSPDGDADVYEIASYIAEDNLEAALRWVDEIDEALKSLAEFPGMGQSRDDFGPGLRSWPMGNYLIFYRAVEGGIELIRVIHGARRLEGIFKRSP